MSFCGSMADAKSNIASVEESENTRTSSGTSPVLRGGSQSGGELMPKRTAVKAATSSLKRQG